LDVDGNFNDETIVDFYCFRNSVSTAQIIKKELALVRGTAKAKIKKLQFVSEVLTGSVAALPHPFLNNIHSHHRNGNSSFVYIGSPGQVASLALAFSFVSYLM
jgi:hypothetical protein